MKSKTIFLLIVLSIIAGLGVASASVISDYNMHKLVCEENLKALSDIPATPEFSSQAEKQVSTTKADLEAFRSFVRFNEKDLEGVDTSQALDWISNRLAECEVRTNRLEISNTFGTSNRNTVDEVSLFLLPGRRPGPIGTYADIEMVALVTGSSPPYKYSLGSFMSGTPPPGMTIDILNGNLIGTPTTAGTYEFEVCVSDMGGRTSCKQAHVVVEEEKETFDSSPFMSVVKYFLNLIGFGLELGEEDKPFIDPRDGDGIIDVPKIPTGKSIYDGTYKGTFNYKYADFASVKETNWVHDSFDLEMTLETSMVIPEVTVEGTTTGGLVMLDIINVWCSDPGFGTGSTGVVPVKSNDLMTLSVSLPLNPATPSSDMSPYGIIIDFPNGASLITTLFGESKLLVSPDGKVLSNSPNLESNNWLATSVVSGPLYDSRNTENSDNFRSYEFTSWSLTKIDWRN